MGLSYSLFCNPITNQTLRSIVSDYTAGSIPSPTIHTAILGGMANSNSGTYASIFMGSQNKIATGIYNTIENGFQNNVLSLCNSSIINGRANNSATTARFGIIGDGCTQRSYPCG